MSRLSGIVLAGGASQRMGHDKAALQLGGVPLVTRAVAALREICDDVAVASGDGHRLDGPWHQVADLPGVQGPMAGLIAGLEAAPHAVCCVLAVDVVSPSTALLRWLASRLGSGHVGAVPRADGHLQPLHAVYRRQAAVVLRHRAAAGERSLVACVREQDGFEIVEPDVWGAITSPGFARNVNTPEDAAGAGIAPPPGGQDSSGSP